MTLRIGWFTTGRGPGSRGLFESIQRQIIQGTLEAHIEFVFSNRERGESSVTDKLFDVIESHNIPLITLSSDRIYRSIRGSTNQKRLEYDNIVMDDLSKFTPQICLLAGYMLIVGPAMSDYYTMINLHPSIPGGPSGTWQQVIWETIRTKPDKTGAMIHIVTNDLDKGPPISYFSFPIDQGPLRDSWNEIKNIPLEHLISNHGQSLSIFQRLRYEEYRRESLLIAETIRSITTGEISLKYMEHLKNNVLSPKPLCLNTTIEASIKLTSG